MWNNFGIALQRAAQYADAIRCFERAAALAATSPPFSHVRWQALSNIAGCALHLRDVRAGIRAVRQVIELNADPQTPADCLSRVIAECHYARLLLEVGDLDAFLGVEAKNSPFIQGRRQIAEALKGAEPSRSLFELRR